MTSFRRSKKTKFRFKEEKRSIIIFESPHRIIKTLNDFQTHFGPDRSIAICRELTKIHEEVLRITVAEALEHFTTNKPRGEFVIIL